MNQKENLRTTATVSEKEFSQIEMLFKQYGLEFPIKDKSKRPERFHVYIYDIYHSKIQNKHLVVTGWDHASECEVFGFEEFLVECKNMLEKCKHLDERLANE